MSGLRDAKILGGIGAILLLLSFIPILPIVGIVLLFIAVKKISDEVKDKDIFKNYLNSFIINIIALFILTAMIIAIFLSGIFSFTDPGQFANISDPTSFLAEIEPLLGGLVGCALAGLIFWILLIFGALYLKKSYDSIADKTDVHLFKTTGLLTFIGAITLIIGIGIIILFIARILEIASYFSLPDTLSKKGGSKKELEENKRKCPNCDRIIPEDAMTCPYCSKKLS